MLRRALDVSPTARPGLRVRVAAGVGTGVLAAALAVTPGLPAASADGSGSPGAAFQQPAAADPLTLWYDEPATDWESEALPIGNGALGATIFGGLEAERLQLNEKTLWTGGPGTPGYTYGNWESPRPGALAEVQETIAREGSMSPGAVADALGQPRNGYGAYQTLGDLWLDLAEPPESPTDYRRYLDLSSATAGVRYQAGGVTYTREYFTSYPAHAGVARLSADEPGRQSLTVRFASPRGGTSVTAEDGRIRVRGALADNGLVYEAQAQVLTEGGTRRDNPDGSVSVEDADAVTLVWSAGTDYDDGYPDYRGEDPHARVTAVLDTAAATSYEDLRAAHVADHAALFDRVSLDIGQAMPDVPTDELLGAYTGGSSAADRALEALFFQYGRYLLIGSSRDGSLPANLQGVWNQSLSPPWSADYHVNINLQMNYWPAEVTNLAETTGPLFEYIDSLRAPGRVTAREMFGADGWVVHNETTPYGFTGVHDWPTAFWFPEAGAWLTQHLFEHYLFSGDETFLAETAYPILRETSQFWLDVLIEDPTDGSLVASPSYSPEHGPFSAGASMSQQIVWDLFTNTIEASQVLGVDEDFRTRLVETRDRLDPGLRVGSFGQLQEWKPDWDDPADQHRHVSQLYALHPGRQISPRTTPDFADAARVTLTHRGDGGTGWSKAWKINFWARLLDGDHAHKMLAEQLKNSTLPNLWDTHPPFQIDGNFGATAGIAEMLLQSHTGAVDLLPAVPGAWGEGSVDGLRARGGQTVGITWRSGVPTEVRLRSDEGGTVTLRSDMFRGKVRVLRANGRPTDHTIEGDTLRLPTRAGESYRIVSQAVVTVGAPSSELRPGEVADVRVRLDAVDRTLPLTRVSLDAPDGFEVKPSMVRIPPVRRGNSATVDFQVRVPDNLRDGTYPLTAVVASDDWTARGGARLHVRRPNHALGRPAEQSSTGFGGVPSRAVDGNTNGAWGSGSVTHTDFEPEAWWQVDLGQSRDIDGIDIWNRTDCCSDRLSDYYVLVSDEPFGSGSLAEVLAQPGVWASHQVEQAGTPTTVGVGRTGRYVRVQLAGDNALSLAEVQVY